MDYKKLQLETILFDNEDIITTSGDTSDSTLEPAQPQPQPGEQGGEESEFIG